MACGAGSSGGNLRAGSSQNRFAVQPAVLCNYIAGIGNMGTKTEGIGFDVVGAHHGLGRIRSHHHCLGLLYPCQLGFCLCYGLVVGKGFTGTEHRLKQRPHRWPVGLLVGADLQGDATWGQLNGNAAASWRQLLSPLHELPLPPVKTGDH